MNNLVRVKCPQCQKVQDINGPSACQCGFQLTPQKASVTVYRKGNPIGSAVGYGVYINGEPFGHIAATETVTYSLPYGSHNFHMTCGLTRKCKDIVVNLSQEYPMGYLRARIKVGFWSNCIIIEPSSPDQMPQK